MKVLIRAALALLVSATVAAPALAQNLTNERANILSVDWNVMQVRLKDPQGRERTWVVTKDATVEFNDKREQFPNPKLADLVPPMYVHFTYKADTKEIVAFTVAEVGFEPSAKDPGPASASQQRAVQNLTRERANILSVDWNVMQVRLKDPQGRERTWVVAKDATVEFNDKREQFPNPKLADLVPPMYVHFTYRADTKEIVAFTVAEVGFEPSAKDPGPASASQQQAVITAVDVNVGQVEVQLPSGRKTFEVNPKAQLRSFKAGDRVTLTISKQGDREVVTGIRRR
jgi:Cu/Ag efflux protein CusF